jgi:voltage-gated potassium channel
MGRDAATPRYLTPALVRWRSATDVPLIALAVGSLPVLLLEFVRDGLPRSDRTFMDVVNLIVLVSFAIDYVVELRLAGDRFAFARSEFLSLLVVVAQLASIVPGLAAFGFLRSLRAVRLLRFVAVVARAAALGGVASREGRALLRRRAASLALGSAGMTWLLSAVAFTIAEDVGTGGRIHSFFDSLWWSLSTMTTVGYGDIYPVTPAGRLVAAVTMLVGISTFAVVTARIAQFLVRSEPSDTG